MSPFEQIFGWFGRAQFMPTGHFLHSVRPSSSAAVPGGQTSIFPYWQNRPFRHWLHSYKYCRSFFDSPEAKVPFWHNIILAGFSQLYPAGHSANCVSPLSVQFVPFGQSFYGIIHIHIKIFILGVWWNWYSRAFTTGFPWFWLISSCIAWAIFRHI